MRRSAHIVVVTCIVGVILGCAREAPLDAHDVPGSLTTDTAGARPAGPLGTDHRRTSNSSAAGRAPNWGDEAARWVLDDALRAYVHAPTGARVVTNRSLRTRIDARGATLGAGWQNVSELVSLLSPKSIEVWKAGDPWALRYELTSLTTGDSAASLPPGMVRHDGPLVEIAHGALVTQQYENLVDGLWQRFVVASGKAGENLVLHGRLHGSADLRLEDAALVMSRGEVELARASAPRAWDSLGRALDVRFVIGEGGDLDLVVGAPAAFPVTVDPLWTSVGDNQLTAQFGFSVASAGDVNADGYADFVIGAPGFDTATVNTGKVYLYLGSATGPSTVPAWTSLGENVLGNFGSSVAGVGDVDGDGCDDVAVGADWFPLPSGQLYMGKAYVFAGCAPGGLSTAPIWSSNGGGIAGAKFGVAVAAAGDVNGDGLGDIIVGADSAPGGGAAYVYLGAAGGPEAMPVWSVSEPQNGAFFGYSVAGAGDVNGDGFDDVLVGAVSYELPSPAGNVGRVTLYLGGPGGPSPTESWSYTGTDLSLFGASLAGAGDLNGDGLDDFLVAAPLGAPGSTIYLFLGGDPPPMIPAWQAAPPGAFPGTIAVATDVGGDGLPDLIVGDPYPWPAGQVFLFPGPLLTSIPFFPSWETTGDALPDEEFGRSVASAGDTNGDGHDDILVGAPSFQVNVGKAYLYFGGTDPSGVECGTAGLVCDDDGNVCTESTCDGDGLCLTAPRADGTPCPDGDACNGDETCIAGACTPAPPIDCEDGDSCTADSCDPASGCTNAWICPPTDGGVDAATDAGKIPTDSGDSADAGDPPPPPGCGCSCGVGRRHATEAPVGGLMLLLMVNVVLFARRARARKERPCEPGMKSGDVRR